MSGHGHGARAGGQTLSQITIVAVLTGLVVLFHGNAIHHIVDPTAMLALGFVILASYTIGSLVDVIKLPHITGYLIAGLVFGPSVAHMVGSGAPAPFDEGILNESVIGQLSLLDTLAVALIAITAGGELKLESLRRGLRAILGILFVQLVTVLAAITGLVWLICGAVPSLTMPGLEEAGAAAIPLGLCIASIAFATSPAATIAVINGTGASGPMSRTVLSTVVLKDVVVVICFAIFSVLAGEKLGIAAIEGSLGSYLATHIGGSIVAGVALGGAMALYLRFVGKELLLFIVGVVYTASYSATALHLDPVLLFLAAGFTVSNFSREGDTLIHSVERLSLPVYVVFFTLAGAKLHLDTVAQVWQYAVALVLVRIVAIWVGVYFGATIGAADPNTKKHGWLGFVSQAGVAITLAAVVGAKFGDVGRQLETLLIGGVALNELLGPVMLKVGLGWAGEIGHDDEHQEHEHDEEDGEVVEEELSPWPDAVDAVQAFGPPLSGMPAPVARRVRDLERDLQRIVNQVAAGPLADFREDAQSYVRDLRRQFLRHHRRLTVQARTGDAEALAVMLHAEQAELAEHWRGLVLGRSARIAQRAWSPDEVVEALDDVVATMPEQLNAPYDPRSFIHPEDERFGLSVRRDWLRVRRSTRRLFGGDLPDREIDFRGLGRFHISGQVPARLEGLAALFVQADGHLASRTRSMFDGIVRGYDELAHEIARNIASNATLPEEEQVELPLSARLDEIRKDVDHELRFAESEVREIERDGLARTARIIGSGVRDMKAELPIISTLDLPARSRRSSKVFDERIRAIDRLTENLASLRKNGAAGYSLLAMELELVGLEAHIKDALEEHVTRLEREVQRRAADQAKRVDEALGEALAQIESEVDQADRGDELALALRQITEVTEKTAGDAGRVVLDLHQELVEDDKLAPLIDALSRASSSLTAQYDVLAGRLSRGELRLPDAIQQIEVPFRTIVTEHIETRVAPRLFEQTRAMSEKVLPLANTLRELERLIAFNVELVTSEVDLMEDDVIPDETREVLREMVAGQLERSRAMVTALVSESAEWPQELGTSIRDAVVGDLEQLRGQLVDGDISRARLEELRRSASRRRLLARAESIPSVLRDLAGELGAVLSSVVGEERLDRLQRFLGLPEVNEQGGELVPENFDVPVPSAKLPVVYRRLFSADSMEAGDVLRGREAVIERARKTLARTPDGRLRSVAIIGTDGVGKAAVASAVVRGARFKQVRRMTFDRPLSVAEVEEEVANIKDAQLVVVSGLHFLTSASPGGFAPLRRFVRAVLDDDGKRAWLMHASDVFFAYAANVAPLRAAFPEHVRLAPLNVDELREAVMDRHRLSGYGFVFGADAPASRIEGALVKSAERIRRPLDQYFDELHAATGGLVRDALRLWLASIRRIEREELVHVGSVHGKSHRALARLPEEFALQLFVVARQGWIDHPTYASLFRVNETVARADLARLAHLGLLRHDEGVYTIPVHLRGGIGRMIRERGWL